MEVVARLRTELYREPRGGRLSALPLGSGLLVVAISVVLALGDASHLDLDVVVMGLAFLCMGAAELVPGDRRRLAGLLRIAATAAFVLFGGIAVLPDLLGTEVTSLGALLAHIVLSLVIVTAIWVAAVVVLPTHER